MTIWPMIALLGATSVASAATTTPLAALRWEKRVLLVFEQGDSARSELQRRMIDRGGAAERDLLVVDVPISGSVTEAGLPPTDTEALRRAYAVSKTAPFTVILVGKDGGVKMRSSDPVPADALFATIDAMPMRQQEAKGR